MPFAGKWTSLSLVSLLKNRQRSKSHTTSLHVSHSDKTLSLTVITTECEGSDSQPAHQPSISAHSAEPWLCATAFYSTFQLGMDKKYSQVCLRGHSLKQGFSFVIAIMCCHVKKETKTVVLHQRKDHVTGLEIKKNRKDKATVQVRKIYLMSFPCRHTSSGAFKSLDIQPRLRQVNLCVKLVSPLLPSHRLQVPAQIASSIRNFKLN